MRETTKTVFHNGHRYKVVRHDDTVTVSVYITSSHVKGRGFKGGMWRRILHEGPTGLAVLAKEKRGR